MKITIDDEFHRLIPPLRLDEYEGLKEDIKRDGCRDALITWNGLILDGHNRYKICNELNVYYKVDKIDLPDREAAKTWIERNQLNRRNLTLDQIRLIRGRLYNRIKKSHGGHLRRSVENQPFVRTSEKLATEFNVSPDTIKRDGKIADYLSENTEEEKKVLEGTKTIKEVKKDRQKMEEDKTAKKSKSKLKYYLTKIRLDALRKQVTYILSLTDVRSNALAPVTTIRNKLKKVMEELNKLQVRK
jgi:hypothetical protein